MEMVVKRAHGARYETACFLFGAIRFAIAPYGSDGAHGGTLFDGRFSRDA